MLNFDTAVIAGAAIGSAVGIGAGVLIGPDGWALGGAVAGGVVGGSSADLAASILDSAKAGVLTALVFATVFGFGSAVRTAIDTGAPEPLVRGLGPFFSIAIIYGVGCFIAAAVVGSTVHVVRHSGYLASG